MRTAVVAPPTLRIRLPQRPPRQRGQAPGFSLTELLVVLAIMILLATLGAPQLLTGVRMQRLQGSASMIAGKLTEARINALKRNRATWLQIDAAAGTVEVQTTGAATGPDMGPCPSDATRMCVGAPGRLSEGVTFGAAPAQVSYDAFGRTTAVQTIQLASTGGATRTITVRLTGAATIN